MKFYYNVLLYFCHQSLYRHASTSSIVEVMYYRIVELINNEMCGKVRALI